MELPSVLNELFKHIDNNKSAYINDLREAVAIKSISGIEEFRKDTYQMVDWTANRLQQMGIEVSLQNIGIQILPNGKSISLPPVLFGSLGNSVNKKTICIYGHLDVTPAKVEDGWHSNPFQLTERDGKLYGRGSSDDKGPVLCWLHAIEGYQKIGKDIPVNLKFIFESMEESGSEGLEQLLIKEKNGFLKGIDYICISDNYWLGQEKPCITYGLRGLCYFSIEIQCASTNLHSGGYGGCVYEAMPDLIYILNTLVDKEGNILINNINKDVASLNPEEKSLYSNIDFNVTQFRTKIGATKLPHGEDKVEILRRRWRYPSLSIHGVQGVAGELGAQTIIPGKVVGKFSIRIVPNQKVDAIKEIVIKYLNQKWKERRSPNQIKIEMIHGGPYWIEDPHHPHYIAGQRAIQHVFKDIPDLTREGGSIPITIVIQQITGKNVILLPIGAGDDNAHAQEEKMNVRNYIEGTKVLGAYLYEVSKL
ncbi:hypothetical protein FQA39_LY14081 [Lamprigera yunnana]|nr:hypothetical protein FQA39_LY14081 [Lamprigera yunnana]